MCQLRCVKNCFLLLNHTLCDPLKNWRFSSNFFFSLFFSLFAFFFSTFYCLDRIFFSCIFHIACNPADPFHFHADVINHLTAWALDRCDLLQLFIHTFCPSVHSWVWCIFCVVTITVYSILLCSVPQIIWRRSPAMIKKRKIGKKNGIGMRFPLTKHPNYTQDDTLEDDFSLCRHPSIHSFIPLVNP